MAGSAWRSDPWGRHEERWFDGTRWTEHVRGRGGQSTDFIGGRLALPPPDPPNLSTRPATAPPPPPFEQPGVTPESPAGGTGRAARSGIVVGIAAFVIVGAASLALFATSTRSGQPERVDFAPVEITMPTEVFTVTTSETFSMSESGGDPAVLADSIELMWSSMGPEQRRALCVAWQASPGSFRESFESEAGGGEVWAELEAVLAERC